ncbi:MAG: hypothetical protein E7376_04345 [Clostridiales bacterium]|nr:hypothetical protein [Clostridiales bacterium]
MRKHYKLISSIVCLLLCVGMIAFGVYAAKNVLVSLNSSVSFTPTTAKLKVFGGVYGSTEYNSTTINNNLFYYANNNGIDADANVAENNDKATFTTWNFGATTFDSDYINQGKDTPDPIYFFIQISNYVERNIKYNITVESAMTDRNLNLSYGTYSASNNSTNLASPKTNGYWDITKTEGSKIDFTIPTVDYKGFSESAGKLVTADINSSEFSTTMLVIKVEVADADEDVASFEFEFVVTAI